MAKRIEELDPNFLQADPEAGLTWIDARAIGLEGQGWNDDRLKRPYARLPREAEGVVREPVWSLAQHSAGLCVRFATDAAQISVRWNLWDKNLAMSHMPATGVSGIDLYLYDDKKPFGKRYYWMGTGIPTAQENNSSQLIAGLSEGESRVWMLYLPLYNGVEKLEIGLPAGSSITPASRDDKPIVCYGTSIVHGGCAMRTGMSYPAIMGRTLDYPVLNLGFSGNGQAEPEVARLLAELDPAVYVLDYGPNLGADRIAENTIPFIDILRQARPKTPIVLVENINYVKAAYLNGTADNVRSKNAAMRASFDKLRARGEDNLLYFHADGLLGEDGEDTVDGTHPTDVGFMRMAAGLTPIVRSLL